MLHLNKDIRIQTLRASWTKGMAVDVLRLDELHPVVSGNKWYKLKYHIEAMIIQDREVMGTFGGAYSNHIVAVAFMCRFYGIKSIGIIRGELPQRLSPTLIQAYKLGMDLQFVSRTAYQNKKEIQDRFDKSIYWVREGGYSLLGMLGAANILKENDASQYSHIICACGTGTMMAGLLFRALPTQQVIGISVLKNNTALESDILRLLPKELSDTKITLFHDYHFGGYAKHPPALIEWMKALWQECNVPTDIVYTSKLLFAVKDLIEKNYFTAKDKVLIVHSGGLQGNRSLDPHILPF